MINYRWLAESFKSLGYRWWIGQTRSHPTEEDLRKTIDKLAKDLYADGGGLIEMGRLMIRRDDKHYDVYLHVGEVDDPGTVHQQD